ncbi:hypothetical protein [Peredibacter starrii]|uniref:GLUG domain-containing protein n=1 Tax=Peredibacter starrii TaxID=28202 RepID=A0AAX4HLI4_9BACT|nr:hypothetical protein [Peredibacter starrii]WPU64091.1 hypothetical protein SOO65_15465 [Peredibacter starrii]
MKQCFILLTLLLTAVACSQKGTEVGLKVSHNFVMGGSNTSAIAGGGLIIWGQSTTGKSFAQLLQDKDELKLSLDNTSWTFYAMAWDGSKDYEGAANSSNNTPFGGIVRCGISQPTILTGEPKSIELSITNPNCSNSVFAGPAGMNGGNLSSVKMQFCSSIVGVTGNTNLCTDTYNDPNKKSYKAPIGSYRFSALTHVNGIDNGSFAGKCVSTTTSLEQQGLPAGGPGLPFRFLLEMFPGSTDCDATIGRRGAEKIIYSNGTAAAPSVATKVYNGLYKTHHYIEITPAQICLGRTGTNLGDHPFAAGTGHPQHPYTICDVPQFYGINFHTQFSSSYKLQANLDFNPFSVGIANTPLPQAPCLELGTNFIPIGYAYATCSGSTIIWDNINTFLGNFFGNGFSLKNLRLRDSDRSHLGLFAHVQGTGIYIGDFSMEKPEIEARFRVGAVAAESTGSSSPADIIYHNIKIKDAEIQGRPEFGDNVGKTDVGGLIGYLHYGTLQQISIVNSKVRGDSSQVGGVVGLLTFADVKKVISEVDVEARSGQSIQDVGGIAGRAENSVFDWVKHEGEIKTDGKQVGGIAGSSNTSSLTNFYTISNINSNSSDLYNYTGGVIGYWTGVGNLSTGYSLANIQTGCSTGCKQGAIVGYAESGTPSVASTVYNLYPSDSGEQATNLSSSFVLRSLGDFRILSSMTALTDTTSDDWKMVNGVYPRFDFEYHPCSSIALPSGTGTTDSPILICNETDYQSYASTGLNIKLMGNIRLRNLGTAPYDIPTFSSKLEGNNKALIGGNVDSAGTTGTAHIGTLTGEIKNLKIYGMRRTNTSANSMASPSAVFVFQNNGKLLNMKVSTIGRFSGYAAGFVGKNAGTIQNVKFDGNVSGSYAISTLVHTNQSTGKIYDSRVGGQLGCYHPSNPLLCDFFAGLAYRNEGEIARTEMNVHFWDNGSFVSNNVSMLVDENVPNAKIIDVVVPNHASFLTRGNGTFYFSRINNGIYQRVINLGKLLAGDLSTSALNGFPGQGNPVLGNNNGIMTDVFRGGISGKLLLENVPYTCANGNTLDIPAWSTLSSWNSYSSGYFSLPITDKKLVVIYKPDSGLPQYQQVTNITGTQLSTVMAACNTSGKVSVVMTSDLFVSPGTTLPEANVILPQHVALTGRYGAGWTSIMWDMNNPDDEQKMLDYHAYKMGLSSTPVPRAVWQLEDEGPRLFED